MCGNQLHMQRGREDHSAALHVFPSEGAGLNMVSADANEATLYRYWFFLPAFTATDNLDHVCIGERDKAMFALAFEQSVECTGYIKEGISHGMGDDMRQ